MSSIEPFLAGLFVGVTIGLVFLGGAVVDREPCRQREACLRSGTGEFLRPFSNKPVRSVPGGQVPGDRWRAGIIGGFRVHTGCVAEKVDEEDDVRCPR